MKITEQSAILRYSNYTEELLINLKVRGERWSPILAHTNLNLFKLNVMI